ncbi:glycosyltransferase 8 domain-containing protein 1-like [Physella acuta]|uniref:glycosyltransferase 8 domain-containing protein 1-like n=1 Tax=Physella acuta TaxID=109671 RepID=UPI0027DE9EA9|nr:glycosyltransferase 8 domain-containing protein 1-like [Physella acuta]
MIFEMGILSARKVGALLAVFWIGTLCYIWLPDHIPDFLNLRTKSEPKKSDKSSYDMRSHLANTTSLSNFDDVHKQALHVCITSDEKTLGGMIALINSIISNTKSPVKFHLVVDENSMDHVSIWIKTSKLKNIDYELKAFPAKWVDGRIKIRGGRKELGSPLNYARYYLPKLFPLLKEKIIFIDDDCIVQGDIEELYKTPLEKGHIAAFSEDCQGQNKRLSRLNNIYAEFLDFKNEHIQQMHIKPTACSFNTGVFVSNLSDWHSQNITSQLEYWMELNTKEEVYGNERGGGGSQPPMMIVFYNKFSRIDPLWHVRHLGASAGTSYSKSFVKKAKLLHWNGPFKPWGRTAQHSDLWEKYFIPDPSGHFKVVRRTTGL